MLMPIPRLRIRIILANGAILDPTKIALLEAIEAKGSISAAARSLEISYRTAWQLVKSINDMLRSPAVATETGGRKRGGATLTAIGSQVIAFYRAIQSQAQSASAHELQILSTVSRELRAARSAVGKTKKACRLTTE
jgi:molybdate transport system regulatory protein